MDLGDLVDSLPIIVLFLGFAGVALVMFEIGFRVGHAWQKRTPEEKEGPTGMLVAAILALMAFLLAITMGMASDRFNTRRALVLDEANAISTTYLRAGYLPEPAAGLSRELLREYVPLRISAEDIEGLAEQVLRSEEIHGELWSIAEDLAAATPGSEMLALYIESLNETIDLHSARVVAGVYARIPETVVLLLLFGSGLTLFMVGYNAGLTGRRSPLSTLVLVVVLSAIVTLIVDTDRPQGSTLGAGQQPLIDLIEQIGPPSS